jgi:hypothetical protein
MAMGTVTEYAEPEPGGDRQVGRPQGDALMRARATATIRHLLEDPRVAREIPDREIQEMLRIRVHVQELARRRERAEQVRSDADQRESNLIIKLDPAGRRILGFWLGAALIAVLTVLDAIPLNWAAQAFDLDPSGTWLVTFILVAASIGAMLGLELTRGQPQRRGVLTAVVTAGYLALLGLRTEFLTAVAGDSLLLAVLQAALLTAISAGLVWCGAAILARTRHLGLSRARAAARRAAAAAEDARAAERLATDKLGRHIGSVRHMLYPWALNSPVPEGVDDADWIAALDQSIHVLFPLFPAP